MSQASPKYNRTPHLPWSPGATNDDRIMKNVATLLGKPLIATEKMDGSNICLERNNVFARSHNQAPNHPSFDALKAVHASVQYKIPDGVQVFGEWLYARHSIAYDALSNWLQIFAVRDGDIWWSWEDVGLMSVELEIPRVTQIGFATVQTEKELQKWVENCVAVTPAAGKEKEGVVVRHCANFINEHFERCVAKWVRANHVQTDDHWKSQMVVVNGVR